MPTPSGENDVVRPHCLNCRTAEAEPDAAHCAPCAVGLRPVAGAPDVRLRPPLTLGRWTAGLLGALALLNLYAVSTDLRMFDLTNELLASGASVADVYTTSDTVGPWQTVATAQAVAYFALGVVLLLWFHRVRRNAEVFSPGGHRRSRGWVFGGWFLPVVNLWFPFQVTSDIWWASARPAPSRRARLLGLWWPLWLISWLLGILLRSAFDDAHTLDSVVAGDGILRGDVFPLVEVSVAAATKVAADGFDVVTMAVTALLVLRLSAAQQEKMSALEAGAPVQAARPAWAVGHWLAVPRAAGTAVPAVEVPVPPAAPVPPHGG